MKAYLLYIAMFLIVLCLPIRGNENEIRWLWEDSSWVPISLLFMSLICIGVYLFKIEKANKDKLSGGVNY
jgi:hypothetical protein